MKKYVIKDAKGKPKVIFGNRSFEILYGKNKGRQVPSPDRLTEEQRRANSVWEIEGEYHGESVPTFHDEIMKITFPVPDQRLSAEEIAYANHKARLQDGITWKDANYPCFKADRNGITAALNGFQVAEQLFQLWIAENGPPTDEATINAMVSSGAVPPEYRQTEFFWSDGRSIHLTEKETLQISGLITVFTSRSFVIRKAEQAALEKAEE